MFILTGVEKAWWLSLNGSLPLGLSPQHNPVSAPMHRVPRGAAPWGRVYNVAREAWSPRLCCPPAPVQDALKAWQTCFFSSRLRESWCLSTPFGRSSTPQPRKPPQQARPQPDPQDAETLFFPEASEQPRGHRPRTGGPASAAQSAGPGGASHRQGQGHGMSEGPRPRGREKHAASCRGTREKGESPPPFILTRSQTHHKATGGAGAHRSTAVRPGTGPVTSF